MSIFGSIVSAIFGGSPAAAAQPEAVPAASPGAPAAAPASPDAPAGQPVAASVDVAAVLTAKAAEAGQTLDWRHSIVDLMKLLNLDSSLGARKTLAGELHYTGNTDDSASMNVWLHAEVMQKLAENGGTVPADLKG